MVARSIHTYCRAALMGFAIIVLGLSGSRSLLETIRAMTTIPISSPILLVASLLVCSNLVATDETAEPQARPELSARKALKEAIAALSRVENYGYTYEITGGLTGTPDHRIARKTFEWKGNARIGGPPRNRIIAVPEANVFRLSSKGVGVWKGEDGVWRPNVLGFVTAGAARARSTKLLEFPERYLAEAARFSRKAAWHEPESKSETAETNRVVRVMLTKKAALALIADEAVDKLIGGCCGAITYTRLSAETTEVYFDVEIERSTSLPLRVELVFVTGQFDGKRGAYLWSLGQPNERIVGSPDERITFHFGFALSEFGEVPVEVPAAARKALSQVR